MKLNRWLLASIATIQTLLPSLAADDTAATIEALKNQIHELDRKVRVLERKQELEKETATEKAKTAVAVSAGPSGFTIRSADSNFVLRVRGGLQADGRFYPGDTTANDTFLLRRVRPALEGTVFDKFDYRIMADFASGVSLSSGNNGSILDAYLNARFLPEFQIQAGKFKEPVGLERLQSWQNLLFVERGFPTQIVPNRDTGVQIHGELLGSRLNYAMGVFNGTTDGGSSDFDATDPDKDLAARLFAHPFRGSGFEPLEGLGLGVAGTIGEHSGAPRGYHTPGQQRFFTYRSGTGTAPNVVADGQSWRLTPQGYYYWGPFGLLGEYVVSAHNLRQAGGGAGAGNRAEVQHSAWQVAVSCFLTGEKNSYKPVIPRKNFSPGSGGWGAFELTARIGGLDVDDDVFPVFADPTTSASSAFSWGAGLNWHLNRNVKLQFNYEHTDFKGGAAHPALAHDEHVLFTRAQIVF